MPTEPKTRRSERPRERADEGYPDNPVLVRRWRGGAVESQQRGAWCLCDARGAVVAGGGAWNGPVFTRSAVKCLQALPLLETGAAERFAFSDREIALAISSHNGESTHTDLVLALLQRMGLGVEALHCGSQPPGDPAARAELRAAGREPTALHNNCSGKHAGFLALALHLGVPVERYLDPESEVQRLVRAAVVETTGVEASALEVAVDGCSAPTFRLPLAGLATAFARVTTPDGPWPSFGDARRAACRRMLGAVAAHPAMIAGRHKRLCTDIARASGGRLFPKIGGGAVYAIGEAGRERALALKIDDEGPHALPAVVVALAERFGFATAAELAALEPWREARLYNWAGLEIGRTEVLV